MAKRIIFKTHYIQDDPNRLRVKVGENGISIPFAGTMTVEEAEKWIKTIKEQIASREDDILVVQKAIEVYERAFIYGKEMTSAHLG